MSIGNVFIAIGIAFGFVFWAIVGKYANAGSAWTVTMVMSVTALVVAVFSGKELLKPLDYKAILILVAAGLINGLACYFYACKNNDPEILSSVFIVTVAVFITMWAPILDKVLNGADLTLRHLVGFGLAASAIFLLGK